MAYSRSSSALVPNVTTPGRGHRILRIVDTYGGVPLIMCLALLRRGPRQLPNPIRRIGLLNTAAIGDTVLMSGPLADLRKRYRNAEVFLLAGPTNYEAACILNPAVNIVKLPIFNLLAAIIEIRRRKLDVLLDFGPWARLNAILTALSGARFTAGFRTAGQYRHYAYDLPVEHSPDVHELDNHRKLVSFLNLGYRHQPRIARWQIPSMLNSSWSKPYLVFHLWAGGTAAKHKEWPIDRWIKLAEHFTEKGYRIVLTGGSSQRTANDRVIEAISRNRRLSVYNQAGLSLAETSAVIAGSALVVSVDTGVMHLSAALDARLVALMGPASRRRWGPVSKRASVIESSLSGCGYLNLGFEIPGNPPKCMEAISFDAVCAACEEALLADTIRLPRKSADTRSVAPSSI
jgi:heptosyltransferase III